MVEIGQSHATLLSICKLPSGKHHISTLREGGQSASSYDEQENCGSVSSEATDSRVKGRRAHPQTLAGQCLNLPPEGDARYLI
jgi:hypothetical protein